MAKEFNTTAADDGIAMGHDGMLHSLPSRKLVAEKILLKDTQHSLDRVDAMVMAADDGVGDDGLAAVEQSACPTCGSCSGIFTANSMNCRTEALKWSLPGNCSVLATHSDREKVFKQAGHLIVELPKRYDEGDDERALPCNITTFAAFENAMALDIAMDESSNTRARPAGVRRNRARARSRRRCEPAPA